MRWTPSRNLAERIAGYLRRQSNPWTVNDSGVADSAKNETGEDGATFDVHDAQGRIYRISIHRYA